MTSALGGRRPAWWRPVPAPAGHWWLSDGLLAAALLGAQLLGLLVIGGPAARWVGTPAALGFMIAGCGLLVVRRRLPLSVLVAQVALVLAQTLQHRPLLSAPALLAAVVTMAAAGWRGAAAGGGAAAVALLAGLALTRASSPATVLTMLGFCLAALSTGLYLSTVRGRRAEARELHARQEQERRLRAEATATHERLRIARELHDVVAHHLSLVVLQAAAARATLPDDDAAVPAVQAAESASRRALEEMRRMVGVLRLGDTGVAAERMPQPSLRDLPQLVEQARSAGIAVEPDVQGDCGELPDGIDLCAYRIIQEALTNVIRHADHAATRVTVRCGPGRLALAVVNQRPRRPVAVTTAGTGMGLVGMRERVSLLGGDISAGPQPNGGWAVRADIPIPQPQS